MERSRQRRALGELAEQDAYLLENIGATIRAAWRRYRSRQRITELDGHLLKDIGVTFADAEIEANKPFWRL